MDCYRKQRILEGVNGQSNVVDSKHTSESHILKLFIDLHLMEREDCLYIVLSFRKGKSQKLCFVLCNYDEGLKKKCLDRIN